MYCGVVWWEGGVMKSGRGCRDEVKKGVHQHEEKMHAGKVKTRIRFGKRK